MRGKTKKQISLAAVLSVIFTVIPDFAYAEGEKVYTQYDMSSVYNVGNIYTSKNAMGNAGYAGAFSYNDFIGSKYNVWQNEWTDTMLDNTLLLDGTPFTMRVVDHRDWKVNTPCVWWNNANRAYTNFDVDDGYYTSLEVIANSDRPTQPILTVKLNYSDGSEEAYNYTLAYFFNGFGNTSTGISVPDCTKGATGYAGHFTIPVNPTKTFVSFDILSDRYNLTSGTDGQPVKNASGSYTVNTEAESHRGRYSHTAAVYAMTLVQDKELIDKMQEEKIAEQIKIIEAAIDSLGEISDMTYDQKDKVDEISELIRAANADGIDIESKISNYEKYISAVEKIKQLYDERVYMEIKDAIDALGEIADMKYEQKDELLHITELIDKARKEGYIISAETVENYTKYEEALIRMEELYTEYVCKEIEDAIDALGNIDELDYSDIDKTESVTKLIDEASKNGITVSEENVLNYAKYLNALKHIKGLTPMSVTIDMSGMYNQGTIYTSKNQLGSAGYAGSVYYPYFISSEYHNWEKPWSEDMTVNTLKVNDTDFQIKAVDFGDYEDSTPCVFWNVDTNSAFTNVQVAESSYTSLEILANADRPINGSKFAVKLVYDDGSEEVSEYGLGYFFNGYGETDKGLAVNSVNNAGSTAEIGYIGHFSIPVNADKKLVSYGILNESYELEKDSSGKYISDENGRVLTKASSASNRDNYVYAAAIYAMTLKTTYKNYEDMICSEIEELENGLRQRMEITDGVPISVTDTGREMYWKLNKYVNQLDNREYVDSLVNYNMLKDVMPTFVKGNAETVYNSVKVSMTFDKPMAINKENVTITKNGSLLENYTVELNENDVSIVFENDFDFESRYDVTVSKNTASLAGTTFTLQDDALYSFTLPEAVVLSDVKLLDTSNKEIDDLSSYIGNTVTITATLSNSANNSQSYMLMICLYNSEGQMIDFDRCFGIIESKSKVLINKTVAAVGNRDCTLKIFSLDDIPTMKTIYKTVAR